MNISRGFDEHERPDIAALYWHAFGAKLGPVLGPDDKARAYIAAGLMPDHALCARDGQGNILGVAGFKTYTGALVRGHLTDLVRAYGPLGGLWRALVLSFVADDTDNQRFLLDGLFVAASARGQGIGSRLLEAIAIEAAERGYTEIRLDVVEGNVRARDLYARRGFSEAGQSRPGFIPGLLGFPVATIMVRRLRNPGAN